MFRKTFLPPVGDLLAFEAAARHTSVSRAAEELHLTQSAVSRQIRQLEEQLGVELFVRERQRLQLSPAGKVLLDYTGKLFALRDQASAAVMGGKPAGDFALGTMYSTAAIHLPALLARYHKQYPAVNLQVQSAPSGELLEGLLTGRLDAALVDGPLELAGLEGDPVPLERWPGAECSKDFCSLVVERGGRPWTLLLARSRSRIEERALAAACERSDVVIADRFLPRSCRPRWLKADRSYLEESGGLALDLSKQRVNAVADTQGAHPWWTGRGR